MDDKFSGFGIGDGVETRLNETLFLYAEVQHVRYGKKTSTAALPRSVRPSRTRLSQPALSAPWVWHIASKVGSRPLPAMAGA